MSPHLHFIVHPCKINIPIERISHLWRTRVINTPVIPSSQSPTHPTAHIHAIGASKDILSRAFVLSPSIPTSPSFTPDSLTFEIERDITLIAKMASLTIAFAPAAGRVFAATAEKSSGASGEKGILDWILGGLQKEDQLVETDPILKKVEEKNGGSNGGRKNSVVVPPKKKGGFGGLFAKK